LQHFLGDHREKVCGEHASSHGRSNGTTVVNISCPVGTDGARVRQATERGSGRWRGMSSRIRAARCSAGAS
jgi:hypothetical protein